MHCNKKTICTVYLILLISLRSRSQEPEEHLYERSAVAMEENLRDQNEAEGIVHRQKINVNKITSDELSIIGILTPAQINQFVLFRKTFGNFISMAELQAIPYWDLMTIKRILPFLTINNAEQQLLSAKEMIHHGEHIVLYRTGGKLIDSLTDAYADQGMAPFRKNNYAQLISYRFLSRDRVQFGLTTEKDAGERKMFDHSSGYLMISKRAVIKQLVFGDYVVNMGQGLIHWQGHTFGKSSNIIQGFKQAELFKPHTGTDENIFHRGVAIHLNKNHFGFSTFVSVLKIDANIINNAQSGERTVSSMLTSGLHRSDSELADKHALKQTTVGVRLAWDIRKGKIHFNHIRFNYDIPISKRPLPYNRFAISGNEWHNTSMDYSWSLPGGLLFGEIAVDKRSKTALIAGVIKSFDPKFDASFIVRNMSAQYKAIHSNTTTQHGEAGNERGFFMCFNFIPSPKTRIEGFTDHHVNSWPLYLSDGIRRGQSHAIQCVWRPDKKNELNVRWRKSQLTGNQEIESSRSNHLAIATTHGIRLQASSAISDAITLRYRAEILWTKNEDAKRQKGVLSYAEIIIKPKQRAYALSGRCAFFETDSYATRIYAYERDLLSYHAVPAHYDNGNRSYIVIHYKLNKAIQLSAKCIVLDREKEETPYYTSDQERVRQLEWRVQLLWKIRS